MFGDLLADGDAEILALKTANKHVATEIILVSIEWITKTTNTELVNSQVTSFLAAGKNKQTSNEGIAKTQKNLLFIFGLAIASKFNFHWTP